MGVNRLLSPPPFDLGQLEAWEARFRACLSGSSVSVFREAERALPSEKTCRLATPLVGPGLTVDTRLTCPPTSWSIQWTPFQEEGYNEGTAVG